MTNDSHNATPAPQPGPFNAAPAPYATLIIGGEVAYFRDWSHLLEWASSFTSMALAAVVRGARDVAPPPVVPPSPQSN